MTAVSAVASPARRPPVEREAGLFVAGDWVGTEGWLSDAAFASGAAAAKAALAQRAPVAA
jgi:predicted NAD/FAD-dependent oxidoreductase